MILIQFIFVLFIAVSCGGEKPQSEDPVVFEKESSQRLSDVPGVDIGPVVNGNNKLYLESDHSPIPSSGTGGYLLRRALLKQARIELVNKDFIKREIDIPFHLIGANFVWIDNDENEMAIQENIWRRGSLGGLSIGVSGKIAMTPDKGFIGKYESIRAPELSLYQFSRLDGSLKRMGSSKLLRNGNDLLKIPLSGKDEIKSKEIDYSIESKEYADIYVKQRHRLLLLLSDFELMDFEGKVYKASTLWEERKKKAPLVILSTKDKNQLIWGNEGEKLGEFLKKKFDYVESGDRFELVKLDGLWDEVEEDFNWKSAPPTSHKKHKIHLLNGVNLETNLENGGVYVIIHANVRDIMLAKAQWKEGRVLTNLVKDPHVIVSATKITERASAELRRKFRIEYDQCFDPPSGRGMTDKMEVCFRKAKDLPGVYREMTDPLIEEMDFGGLSFKYFSKKKWKHFNSKRTYDKVGLFRVDSFSEFKYEKHPKNKIGQVKLGLIRVDEPRLHFYRNRRYLSSTKSWDQTLYEETLFKINQKALVPSFK